jgi:hypothetical protein
MEVRIEQPGRSLLSGCVGFWEQNGSGESSSDAVRRCHSTLMDTADVQEHLGEAASSASVLSSHRGIQVCGVKSLSFATEPSMSPLVLYQWTQA